MRLLDLLKNANRDAHDSNELSRLRSRLNRHSGTFQEQRDSLINRVMEATLPGEDTGQWRQIGDLIRERIARILTYERLFVLEEFSTSELSTAQIWEAIGETKRQLAALEDGQTQARIIETLTNLVREILPKNYPNKRLRIGRRNSQRPLSPFCLTPPERLREPSAPFWEWNGVKPFFPKSGRSSN
jgi:hypothetical protein